MPEGWFTPRIPKGYANVEAGVRPRLSEEVREVYDKVAAARRRFGNYRAVIWRDGTDGWPSYREAKLGNQWRADQIDWTIMHSAMHRGNEGGYVRIGPGDPFRKLWGQVTRDNYELDMSALRRGNRYAIIHYDLTGRGPSVSAKVYASPMKHGYDDNWGPTLHELAWPEWVWSENLLILSQG